MLLYAIAVMILELMDAEGFQSRGTIVFSILYFILVGVTEELVFRGIVADLVLRAILNKTLSREKRNVSALSRNREENTTAFFIVSACVISGAVFALAHALNLRNARWREHLSWGCS